jgi:hypothetical protein
MTRKFRRSGERPRSFGGRNSEPSTRVAFSGQTATHSAPLSPSRRRSKPLCSNAGAFSMVLKCRLLPPNKIINFHKVAHGAICSQTSPGPHSLGLFSMSDRRFAPPATTPLCTGRASLALSRTSCLAAEPTAEKPIGRLLTDCIILADLHRLAAARTESAVAGDDHELPSLLKCPPYE